MDWGAILTEIIFGVVGLVITGLGIYITHLINTKIKDENLKKALLDATEIAFDAVDYVRQTYSEALKGTDFWDEEAMAKANAQAIEYVETHLSQEIKDYVVAQGKDLTEWIKEQVEIALQRSK